MRKILEIVSTRGYDVSNQIDLSTIEIQRLWTIYNEKQLWNSYHRFNPYTGEKIEEKEITIDDLELKHNNGVFLEERLNDWSIHNNKLNFYSRVVKQDEKVKILIEYEVK
jgi:hypothetical protein